MKLAALRVRASSASLMNMPSNRLDFSQYLRREPFTLALLSLGVVVSFLLVAGISRVFFAQQEELAKRWSTRGVSDLNAGNYIAAIPEFRTALLYSRDDFNFRLGLAQALMGLHRTPEADSYLVTLRAEHPENGLVNLELARIAAQRGDTTQALRFYHTAIYATWPGDEEKQEQEARFELVGYLLKINAKAQAESELISLAAFLGNNSSQQARLGSLFASLQDNEHALSAFRRSLVADPHNPDALRGAGLSAFALGRYRLAVRYLQQALPLTPDSPQIREQLQIASLVQQLDPFQPQLHITQTYGKAVAAFAAAGQRLQACPVAGSYAAPDNPTQDLSAEWKSLKPRVTESGLRANPDLVNTAMNLVFTIERQANDWCGKPTPTDSALLLIADLREGS